MNQIVLAGKFTDEAKDMFRKRSEGRFEVVSIKTLEEMDSVKNAAYFVARGIPFKKTEIDQLGDGVKLIHRWGVGYDSVDIETAGKRGIVVAICAGGNAQPVAEMAVLLMLASYRRLLKQVQRAKDGRSDKDDIATESYLLQGKKVGIVGFGNIGRRVCKIVQGFGATVQYFDFFRPDTQTEKELHAEFVPFDELVKTSDIITVHAPLTDQTRGMFGAREFAMMKNSAMFVNTARGGLADTGAMMDAVERGDIAFAALDTIEGEPVPPSHPALHHDRVILTPHGAGNTADNSENMVEIIMNNITMMEAGNMPEARYVVNAQYLQ